MKFIKLIPVLTLVMLFSITNIFGMQTGQPIAVKRSAVNRVINNSPYTIMVAYPNTKVTHNKDDVREECLSTFFLGPQQTLTQAPLPIIVPISNSTGVTIGTQGTSGGFFLFALRQEGNSLSPALTRLANESHPTSAPEAYSTSVQSGGPAAENFTLVIHATGDVYFQNEQISPLIGAIAGARAVGSRPPFPSAPTPQEKTQQPSPYTPYTSK